MSDPTNPKNIPIFVKGTTPANIMFPNLPQKQPSQQQTQQPIVRQTTPAQPTVTSSAASQPSAAAPTTMTVQEYNARQFVNRDISRLQTIQAIQLRGISQSKEREIQQNIDASDVGYRTSTGEIISPAQALSLQQQNTANISGFISDTSRQRGTFKSAPIGYDVVTPGIFESPLKPGQMGPGAPVQGYVFSKSPEQIQREQVQFSKDFLKQTESLPIGLQQIARTGFFMESNLYSMGKPIAQFAGLGKEFDIMTTVAMSQAFAPFDIKQSTLLAVKGISSAGNVHYVNWMDYLPGIGNVEAQKVMSKYPWEAAVGNVMGEIGSTAIFYGVGKGVSTGVKSITRTAITKAPEIVPRISSQFSNVFGKGFSIVEKVPGYRYISGELERVQIPQNIAKWSMGYVPGKTLAEIPVRTSVEQGWNIQKFMYKPMGERIWMSPAEQVAYKTRLARGGFLELGFPTSKQLGMSSQRITMGGTGESFHYGLFGGVKGRNAMFFTKEDIVGVTHGTSKGGSKAYYASDIVQLGKDVGISPEMKIGIESNIFKKNILQKGYSVENPLITMTKSGTTATYGTNIKFYSGFGPGKTWITSEKPVWNLRKLGFIEDTRAMLSETIQVNKPTFLSRTPRSTGLITFNVPSMQFDYQLSGGFSKLGYEIFGTTIKQTESKTYIQPQLQMPVQQRISNVDFVRNLKTNQDVMSVQDQIQKQMQITTPEFMQLQIQGQKTIIPTYTKFNYGFTPVRTEIPFFNLPKLKMESTLAMGGDIRSYLSRYKFRKFKVPSLDYISKAYKL